VARFCEFTGLDRHALSTRLSELQAKPVGKVAQAVTYSLRDLVRATIGGDIEAEKLRKTREEADKLALANSRSRGELVEITAVKRLGEKIMVAIRNRILAMPLTDEEKDRCLVELMGLASLDWSRSE
jgi:phage terminase Nu1 subunit (DNA packaging protein)